MQKLTDEYGKIQLIQTKRENYRDNKKEHIDSHTHVIEYISEDCKDRFTNSDNYTSISESVLKQMDKMQCLDESKDIFIQGSSFSDEF